MPRIGFGIALSLAVLSASPALAAGSPQTIIVTVGNRNPQPDHLVQVRVTVLDEADEPVNVDYPDELLEVRDDSGMSLPFRPKMRQTYVGVYETNLSFSRSGVWTIIVGPDETDVTTVPAQVKIFVRGRVTTSIGSESIAAAVALVLFVLLVVAVFGSRLRRLKRAAKEAPEPEAHDTWWW
ncbi:MAG: hypothetical protein GWP04_10140 [Gammaproteobacteria bacterium]|nr:hypothetical protein [Gammaproteobacteria bacterium]